MSKFYETKAFKDLDKKWQTKLKKDGFKDAEQPDGNLKFWSSQFFKINYNKTLYEAKEFYYRCAAQFLHTHKFKNKTEQTVWKHHANGLALRSISKLLGANHVELHLIVVRLRKIMLDQHKKETSNE